MPAKRARGSGGRGRGGSKRPAPKKEETKTPESETGKNLGTEEDEKSIPKEEKKEDKHSSKIPLPKATGEQKPSGRDTPKIPGSRLPVPKSLQEKSKETKDMSKRESTPTPGPSPPSPAGSSSRKPLPRSPRTPEGGPIQTTGLQPQSSKAAGSSGSKSSEKQPKIPATPGKVKSTDVSNAVAPVIEQSKTIAPQEVLQVRMAREQQSEDSPLELGSDAALEEDNSDLTLATSEESLEEELLPPLDPLVRLSGRFPNTGSPLISPTFAPSPLRNERPTSSSGRPESRRGDYTPILLTESDTSDDQPSSSGERPKSRRGDYSPGTPATSVLPDLPLVLEPDSEDPVEWINYYDTVASRHTPTRDDFPPGITNTLPVLIDEFLIRQRDRPVPERRTRVSVLKPPPAQISTQGDPVGSQEVDFPNIPSQIVPSVQPYPQYQGLSPISERSERSERSEGSIGSRLGSLALTNQPESRKTSVLSVAGSEVSEAGSSPLVRSPTQSSTRSERSSELPRSTSQASSSPFIQSPLISPTQSQHSRRSGRLDSTASDAAQQGSDSAPRTPVSPGSQYSQGSRGFDYGDVDSEDDHASQPAEDTTTQPRTQSSARSQEGTEESATPMVPTGDAFTSDSNPPSRSASITLAGRVSTDDARRSSSDSEDLYNASPERALSSVPPIGLPGDEPSSPPPPPSTPVAQQRPRISFRPEPPPRDRKVGPAAPQQRDTFESPARPSGSPVVTGSGFRESTLELEDSDDELIVGRDPFRTPENKTRQKGETGSSESPYTLVEDSDDEIVTPPRRQAVHPKTGVSAPPRVPSTPPRPSIFGGIVQSDDENFGYIGGPLPRPNTVGIGSTNPQTPTQTGGVSTVPSTGASYTTARSSNSPKQKPGASTASGGGDPGHPDSSDDDDDDQRGRNSTPDSVPSFRPKRDSDSDSDDGLDFGLNPSQGQAAQGPAQNAPSSQDSAPSGGSQGQSGGSSQQQNTQGGGQALNPAPGVNEPLTPGPTPGRQTQGPLGGISPQTRIQGGGVQASGQNTFPPTPDPTPQVTVGGRGRGRAAPVPQSPPPRFTSAAAQKQPDPVTPRAGPTPVREGRKHLDLNVLDNVFDRAIGKLNPEQRQLGLQRLPLPPSSPGFPTIRRELPKPFRDPRVPPGAGVEFNAQIPRDRASPTEEQIEETRRGFQRLVLDLSDDAPREKLPDPDDEAARIAMDLENQINNSENPEIVLATRAEQVLNSDRNNFQAVYDRARGPAESILTWRSFAVSPENILTRAVELGNAAVDDAMSIADMQRNDIIAIKVECLRLQQENREIRDIAEGTEPEGFLTSVEANRLRGEHKWEMERRDDEVEDRERAYNQLLASTKEIQEDLEKNEREHKTTLARIRKERDEYKRRMRAAEIELQTLKNDTQPPVPPSAELRMAQQLLAAAQEEIATLRIATTADMSESALRSQLTTLQAKHASLQQNLAATEVANIEIARQSNRAGREKNALTDRVNKLERDAVEAVNTIKTHENTIQTLNRTVQDQSKIIQATPAGYDAQTDMTTLQGKLDRLQAENKDLQEINAQLLDSKLPPIAPTPMGAVEGPTATEVDLQRQIVKLKGTLKSAEETSDLLRDTVKSLGESISRVGNIGPTSEQYIDHIASLHIENAQLRNNIVPPEQMPTDLEAMNSEIMVLRGRLTQLRREDARLDALTPETPVGTENTTGVQLFDLEQQLIRSTEVNEATSLELADVKKRLAVAVSEAERMAGIHRRERQALETRNATLKEAFEEKVGTIKSLREVINGEVFQSMDGSGDLDDHEMIRARIQQPEVPLTIPEDDEENMVLSEACVELGIARVQILLYNLVQQRALYGLRSDDANAASSAASQTVNDAIELNDPVLLARSYFWYAITLYHYDDIQTAQDMFIEATRHGDLPPRENEIIAEWMQRLDDGASPEREATAYGGGGTLTFAEASKLQAQARAEQRAARTKIDEFNKTRIENIKAKAKRKLARQATRHRNENRLRRKRREARPKKGDDTPPQASRNNSDSDGGSDFPRPGGSGGRIRMSEETGMPATPQKQSGRKSTSSTQRLRTGQGSSTMTIEESSTTQTQSPATQTSWWSYIPFVKSKPTPPAPPPRDNYYYEPMTDEFIPWDGKYVDDPDKPWVEDEYRRNEFETRPVPNSAMGLKPEYDSGAELTNPYSRFNEISNLARVLHDGLEPDERVPTAEELVGECGRGLYVTYEEGSEGWLYGQRILDNVRRRLDAIVWERIERRTKEDVSNLLRAAADHRDEETEDERMTREISSRAQQAYIRDQEYYRTDIYPEDILAASEVAVEKWRAFQKHAVGFFDQTIFGPDQVTEVSFRWLDEYIKNDMVQRRVEAGGDPMTELESRMNKWVRYTQPIEALKDILIDIGELMWDEYPDAELVEGYVGDMGEAPVEEEMEMEFTEGQFEDINEEEEPVAVADEQELIAETVGQDKDWEAVEAREYDEEGEYDEEEGEYDEEEEEGEYTEEELEALEAL